MKPTTRLGLVLVISSAFFCVEIAVGFRTKSLALIADAFHYLNDLVAYAIAFVASYLKDKGHKPTGFTYAFHRAELVGAFFNGVFLLALALSIFLQSLERFIQIEQVNDPLSVLIVGGVGLTLNIISALVIHEHHHEGTPASPPAADTPNELPLSTIGEDGEQAGNSSSISIEEGDIHALHNHVRLPGITDTHANLGLLGVLIHVLGDAFNNIGVMIAATIIWRTHSPARFYADPAASMIISFVIFAGAIPLTTRTGRILLEAAPVHVDLDKIREDLLSLPDVMGLHDLHVWHLSQSVLLSSFHVLVPPGTTLMRWEHIEKRLRECMAAYGITHVTVGPEISPSPAGAGHAGCDGVGCSVDDVKQPATLRQRTGYPPTAI